MSENIYITLLPIIKEGLLPKFLTELGFIHANDHCHRGCLHCPAYGDTVPLQNVPFSLLRQVVKDIGSAYDANNMKPKRSIASWRISDPLDYFVHEGKYKRTTYDVAQLWYHYLHQGLYLVTNGTEGKLFAREALQNLVKEPQLLSQIKLTITPCDAEWGTAKYFQNILWDIQTLAPLWSLPSLRQESIGDALFRINVKITEETRNEALRFLFHLLRKVGYNDYQANELLHDRTRIAVKEIYDLGSAMGRSQVNGATNIVLPITNKRYKPTPEVREQYQYGIYPDGSIKQIDMYAFHVESVFTQQGLPLKLSLPPTTQR